MVPPLWKTVGQFLKKQNIHQVYGPVISRLGVHPRQTKAHIQTKTWTQMFRAVFYVTASNWKQLTCPSTGEWINILWYVHTREFYSAISTNTHNYMHESQNSHAERKNLKISV